MKKIGSNSNFKRSYLKKILINLWFLGLILFSSISYCQNISGNLHGLSLSREDFLNLYNNDGDQKIVLQFALDTSIQRPAIFTLVAWASQQHEYNDDIPDDTLIILDTTFQNVVERNKQTIFGDQQMKRGLIKRIKKMFDSTPGGVRVYKSLFFKPIINDLRHVVYEIFISEVSILKDTHNFTSKSVGKTDPSPPAHSN